jgi:hypothetical protein
MLLSLLGTPKLYRVEFGIEISATVTPPTLPLELEA